MHAVTALLEVTTAKQAAADDDTKDRFWYSRTMRLLAACQISSCSVFTSLQSLQSGCKCQLWAQLMQRFTVAPCHTVNGNTGNSTWFLTSSGLHSYDDPPLMVDRHSVIALKLSTAHFATHSLAHSLTHALSCAILLICPALCWTLALTHSGVVFHACTHTSQSVRVSQSHHCRRAWSALSVEHASSELKQGLELSKKLQQGILK